MARNVFHAFSRVPIFFSLGNCFEYGTTGSLSSIISSFSPFELPSVGGVSNKNCCGSNMRLFSEALGLSSLLLQLDVMKEHFRYGRGNETFKPYPTVLAFPSLSSLSSTVSLSSVLSLVVLSFISSTGNRFGSSIKSQSHH